MEEKEFYRAEELAAKLDVNVMTIYRYIKSGKIIAYKFEKEFRVRKEDYVNFLKNSKFKKK